MGQFSIFSIEGEEIKKRFGFHPATDETRGLHQGVRQNFIDLAERLAEMLPESREKSLAFTALQEAAMWSNAAVACNLAPQVDE